MIAGMEVCTARGIPNIPSIHPKLLSPNGIHYFNCTTQFPFMLRQMRLDSGLRCRINSSLRPITSEETSSERTPYGEDEPEPNGEIIVEKTYLDEKKEDDTQPDEESQKVSLTDYPEFLKFLEEFDIKLDDYEDKYSVLVLGGSSLVALWLAAAVVGAIDSIPLFPKVMELVGLGFTVWFTSRYLLFKEGRDELVARVEQIKQEVLGSKDY